MTTVPQTIPGPEGSLAAALHRPAAPIALLVFAHGAGAGFEHANIVAIAGSCEDHGLAVLRFNFPFAQAGRRRVDPPAAAMQAIAAAVAAGQGLEPGLPLFLGGHSFGGRMATHAVVEPDLAQRLAPVRGVVLCSFPLHPAGKPGTSRAAHLIEVRVPMLFLSGTRDALAQADLLSGVVSELPDAELNWLDTADHGYRLQKRKRGSAQDVFDEMGERAAGFVNRVIQGGQTTV